MLAPLGPRAVEDVTVALGFLALSACGWVIYRLGADWFGRAAGALAALSSSRACPCSPTACAPTSTSPTCCSCSAPCSSRRAGRAAPGAPVLALLALAGLLRPEAWVFSGLYWLYC